MTVIFFLSAIIVNPIGNFPLNDDWRYAYPIFSYVENGQLLFSATYKPSTIFQIASGILITKINGEFTFTLLRLYTLSLHYLLCLVCFVVIKHLFKSELKALFASLVICFNPLIFCLAFSFMTDTHFLIKGLTSVFLYLMFYNNNNQKYRITAIIFALISFLDRQPGILILVLGEAMFLAKVLLSNSEKNTKSIVVFLSIFALSVLLYKIFPHAINTEMTYGNPTKNHYINPIDDLLKVVTKNPFLVISNIVQRYILLAIYIAMFSLIFIENFFVLAKKKKILNPIMLLIGIIFSLGISYSLHRLGKTFPYSGNVIYNLGLGPLLLDGNDNSGQKIATIISRNITYLIAFFIQLYAFFIISLVLKEWKLILSLKNLKVSFLSCLIVLYCGAMFLNSFFDRYVAFVFPLFILLIFELFKNDFSRIKTSNVILLSLTILFSVAGTKDYLQWNRIVKDTHTSLLKENIESNNIDAGHAINGFYENRGADKNDLEYRISFTEDMKYETINSKEYFSFVGVKTDTIYTLRLKSKNSSK